MAYIVESEFKHCGYKCVVTFGDLGHRCGYVGISKRNELYGKDYSDYLDIYKEDIEDKEISGIVPLFIACIDPDERKFVNELAIKIGNERDCQTYVKEVK